VTGPGGNYECGPTNHRDVREEPSLRSRVSAAARAEGGSSGLALGNGNGFASWACVCSCDLMCLTLREETGAMLHYTAGTGIVKRAR
jgi:hypothetical protein